MRSCSICLEIEWFAQKSSFIVFIRSKKLAICLFGNLVSFCKCQSISHNLKSKLSIQPLNKILTWKEQGPFCVLRLLEQKQKTPFPAMIKQKDNFKGRTTTMHFFLIRTVLLAQMAFFSQNTAENCYYYIPCRNNT